MKSKNMITYTIKKSSGYGLRVTGEGCEPSADSHQQDEPMAESLILLNERGEEVSALEILKEAEPHRVFAFDGQMGAGKTTFIKKLCEEMGTMDVVNSPTFAIVNVYDVDKPHKGEVYHFDCYRLKDIREAMDFGAEEYLYSGNYCFIEWPEMIEALLPDDTVWVKITPMADGSRKVTVERGR